jgi:carnitine monooxygenase subunit
MASNIHHISPHSNAQQQDFDPQEDYSLPGWVYHDEAFLAREIEHVLRPSWQLLCHQSEVPHAGDWQAMELFGERVVALRGQDGEVRVFANVCKHRAMRLLDGAGGNCASRLVCPYHAWTYDDTGKLTGVPSKSDYVALDMSKLSLHQYKSENWHGFIFFKLKDEGGPSVAEMMAPFAEEVALYRIREMRPLHKTRQRTRAVNWKTIADNYSDHLHIPVAHPGLTRIFAKNYQIEATQWADRLGGPLAPRYLQNTTARTSNHSELAYQKFRPHVAHLPEDKQDYWLYYKLWPNLAFDIYSDQIDFMQFIPISATHVLLRENAYALPDERREMRAARYLNGRINRYVNAEDTWLITGVQQGMASRSFAAGPLGKSEVCLRSFARKLRHILPEARLDAPPLRA